MARDDDLETVAEAMKGKASLEEIEAHVTYNGISTGNEMAVMSHTHNLYSTFLDRSRPFGRFDVGFPLQAVPDPPGGLHLVSHRRRGQVLPERVRLPPEHLVGGDRGRGVSPPERKGPLPKSGGPQDKVRGSCGLSDAKGSLSPEMISD